MKITLEVRHIFIPFRFAYGHAKASHRGVESIVCIARDTNGQFGVGEAVPRLYVTGESCASVMADVKKIAPVLLEAAADLDSLRAKLLELAERREGPFPSCAYCVVELALLDLLTRRAGLPFHAALGEQKAQTLSYSGSIGMGKKPFLHAQLLAYRAMGLKSFKLKVGGNHDLESLRLVRNILGHDVRVFVDANGAWERETAIRRIEELHQLGVWAIEEPLKRRAPQPTEKQLDCEETLDELHYKNNAWLRKRAPMALIADESVISLRSLRMAVEHRAFDVVDIRLSKLGGGLLSARMVQEVVEADLQYYIGAMVGETAILATAGSEFGSVFSEHLLIQGHSHRALLGRKITTGGPRLRLGGTLRPGASPGLGISLKATALDRVTRKKEVPVC